MQLCHSKSLSASKLPPGARCGALSPGKKKARYGSGLNLISWRRIEETGAMMPRRTIYFYFLFMMIEISNAYISRNLYKH
jgi:hypothetical protein